MNLRKSEVHFRHMANTLPTLVWVSDAHGLLTFLNQPWVELTGRTIAELQGGGWVECLHPLDRQRCQELFGDAVQARRSFAMEYRVRGSDGDYHWLLDHGVPRMSSAGNYLGHLGSCLDITERKRAEEARRESERRYRTIFESAAVSILEADISKVKFALARLREQGVTDLRGYLGSHPEFVRRAVMSMEILDINATCLAMFGADNRRALLGSFERIFLPETQQVLAEELVALAEGQAAFQSEITVQTLQGKRLNILYTIAVPPPTSSVDSILVTFMDITERRRAQEEIQALAGRLLSAQEEERRWIARELHDDVTQRLAVLAIETGKLEQRVSTGQHVLRRQLQALHEQLVSLSADVHGLSRKLHPAILEDLGLVDALAAECFRLSEHGGPRVVFTSEPVPEMIPRNIALCLYRIAQEALHNILKYAQAQEVQVTLTGKREGIRLRLCDDGIGFDLAQARRKGGLGLASMRERLRLIDGRLAIRTRPGAGTHIEVWVPLHGRS